MLQDVARVNRWPIVAAYGYGFIVALVLGHFLLGIPIQFSDSFGNMLKLSTPWNELIPAEFEQRAFLRPMLWAGLKGVYDLSGGNYFAWYRGVHVAQIVLLVVLYLGLVRPRTWVDAALVPFGLAMLVSMPTFTGTVTEAFPVNTFLSVLLFCFAAALIALVRYHWWNDLLAVALFVVAALTLETGLLVWVIFVGAALVGARGVSRAGLIALVLLLVGYFWLRFMALDVGVPALTERSSGFGFGVLDTTELQERFGANPLPFYIYNVATSALSVLFAEPSAGVFSVTSALVDGNLTVSMVSTVVASASATVFIALFAWRRRAAWLARRFERDDQLMLLFAMVLAANAAISYPYTKDVVMSPAGTFMAIAGFVAIRGLVGQLPSRLPRPVALTAVALFAIVGTTWALQYANMHLALRRTANRARIEWAYAEGELLQRDAVASSEWALFRRLHDDAVYVHPAPPPVAFPLRVLFRDE